MAAARRVVPALSQQLGRPAEGLPADPGWVDALEVSLFPALP